MCVEQQFHLQPFGDVVNMASIVSFVLSILPGISKLPRAIPILLEVLILGRLVICATGFP